jgi:hypothetical protein
MPFNMFKAFGGSSRNPNNHRPDRAVYNDYSEEFPTPDYHQPIPHTALRRHETLPRKVGISVCYKIWADVTPLLIEDGTSELYIPLCSYLKLNFNGDRYSLLFHHVHLLTEMITTMATFGWTTLRLS